MLSGQRAWSELAVAGRGGRAGPPLLRVPVVGVSSDANSTLRLVESGLGVSSSRVQAVRWISAGADGSYTPLARNSVTLGRDEQAGVRLEAAGVSRHHAEFVREPRPHLYGSVLTPASDPPYRHPYVDVWK